MTSTYSVLKRSNNWTTALAFLFLTSCGSAHLVDIQKARHDHTNGTLSYENGPLTREDIAFLKYFDIDKDYRIKAMVETFSSPDTIVIPTYSGKEKPFIKWGKARFTIKDKACTLILFQNVRYLPKDPNHLFIPFKDGTSGETTYGGGRYLDLDLQDMKSHRLIIDFNLAYNPWCAYSEGFNCPIPPTANHLDVLIEAGEMNYAKY